MRCGNCLRENCSRKAPTRVRGRVAKAGKSRRWAGRRRGPHRSEKRGVLKGNRNAHKSAGLASGLSISYYDFFHPVSCICDGYNLN